MNVVSSAPVPGLSRPAERTRNDVPVVYGQWHRPADGSLTRSEWLLGRRCRLRPGARPSGWLCQLLAEPYTHRTRWCPLPAWEVEALANALAAADNPGTLSPALDEAFERARRAKQILESYLYPESEVAPIAAMTQAEAAEILERRWWCPGSSRGQHIAALGVDHADELRTTTTTDAGRPTVTPHRNGRRFQGLRAGGASRLIEFDADRHRGNVPIDEQVRRVILLLGVLLERHPDMRPHVTNLNRTNASCHVACYQPRCLPVEEIAAWVEALRDEYPWLREWKTYPADLPQVYMPLRLDKATVIDGMLATATHRRKESGRFEKVTGHDWVAYLDWLESDRPCDPAAVEAALRAARVPDAPPKAKTAGGRGKRTAARTPGPSAGNRGRFRQLQVDFWEGRFVPAAGEGGRLITSALRFLIVAEGFSPEAAAEWAADGIDRLPDASFVQRLGRTGGREALRRSLLQTARRVAKDNGWQRDPAASTTKLLATKAAWERIGFVLSDRSTWHRAGRASSPRRRIPWDDGLENLPPALAAAGSCSEEQARVLAEEVATHVAGRGELALTYLGYLIEKAGGKSYANKQVAVRRCLERSGFLVKVRNGFRDAVTGRRRGSLYALGDAVRFVDEGGARTPATSGSDVVEENTPAQRLPAAVGEHLSNPSFPVPTGLTAGDFQALRRELRRVTALGHGRCPA